MSQIASLNRIQSKADAVIRQCNQDYDDPYQQICADTVIETLKMVKVWLTEMSSYE